MLLLKGILIVGGFRNHMGLEFTGRRLMYNSWTYPNGASVERNCGEQFLNTEIR